MFGFLGVLGGIIGAVIGAAVVVAGIATSIVVLPAVAAGVVVGIGMCAFNAFNICPPSSSSHTSTGGTATTIITPPKTTTGTKSSGTGSGGSTGGGSVGAICSSTGANSCGMHGTGVLVGGVCNASVPNDNACPAPVISAKGFYANPTLVKSGEQTTLYWSVTGATSCTLKGGGLDGLLSTLAGTKLTGSITQKTTYTLTCQDGAKGGPSTSASATVNLDPSFQNQ